MALRVGVLGLGEAGSLIARDLVREGAEVLGYDPRVPVLDGVPTASSEAEAVADADVAISLTASADSHAALTNALPGLSGRTIWADAGTSAARAKVDLASIAGTRGVGFVDVALMAPVPGRGLRTPMLVSGADAQTFAEALEALGADVTVQPGDVGTATARKLLRSVFYKGVAAAVVEAVAAAEAAGCRAWLEDNIRAELDGFDASTLDRLLGGSRLHARRRAEEMATAAEQVAGLGLQPHVSEAARQVLCRLRDEDPAYRAC